MRNCFYVGVYDGRVENWELLAGTTDRRMDEGSPTGGAPHRTQDGLCPCYFADCLVRGSLPLQLLQALQRVRVQSTATWSEQQSPSSKLWQQLQGWSPYGRWI